MRIFLDTSSLFKLYHRESDTEIIESLFSDYKITTLYLSEITKIEFASTVWKKVRTLELSEKDALITLQLFEDDHNKYTFVATDSAIVEQARRLMSKYGFKGLRTLDSIQLATAVSLISEVTLFLTSDNLLKNLLSLEGLLTEI